MSLGERGKFHTQTVTDVKDYHGYVCPERSKVSGGFSTTCGFSQSWDVAQPRRGLLYFIHFSIQGSGSATWFFLFFFNYVFVCVCVFVHTSTLLVETGLPWNWSY